MPVTHAVIELLGQAALLLWGVHMVRTGVLRAFGGDLRRVLGRALRGRFTALLAGIGVTLVLQSSTATAMMAASFVASGAIGLSPALAVMLGANVGSALVSYALSFDITLVYPVLILAGLVSFRSSTRTLSRNLGRAVIGLGLMLLALHLLVGTAVPGATTPQAGELLADLTREPLLVLIVSGVFAWAMHSSIAAVLVIAALANAGLVDGVAALAMILGANLGSALNPLIGALSAGPAALRLPVGNLINRLAGCALALSFLPELATVIEHWQLVPGRQAVAFHLLFNVALAVLFFFLLPAMTRALQRVLADRPLPDDPATPRYLDLDLIATPAVALANAARETLRMADVVEAMLAGSRELLDRDDRRLVVRLRRMDDVLDRLHVELKQFLSELAQTRLRDEERDRLVWTLAVALNLEQAGDIIDKGLLSLATKRMRRRLRFLGWELAELEAMHDHLAAQLRLAVSVFMASDLRAALRLVEEKERFRDREQASTAAQFARLQEGRRGLETSGLHLDTVRDLKRIEALLAAVAHPLLERSSLLRPSRLVIPSHALQGRSE